MDNKPSRAKSRHVSSKVDEAKPLNKMWSFAVCAVIQCGNSRIAMCPGHDRSGLEVVQPMLHDLAALVEGLLVHAHDDGRVRVAVVVDVDWELLDADVVEGLDHLELILPQRKGGELEARGSCVRG